MNEQAPWWNDPTTQGASAHAPLPEPTAVAGRRGAIRPGAIAVLAAIPVLLLVAGALVTVGRGSEIEVVPARNVAAATPTVPGSIPTTTVAEPPITVDEVAPPEPPVTVSEPVTPETAPPVGCTREALLAASRVSLGGASVTDVVDVRCEGDWAGACVMHSVTGDTDCYRVLQRVGNAWAVFGDWDVCPAALIAAGAPADVAGRLAPHCHDVDPMPPGPSGGLTCLDPVADAELLGAQFSQAFTGFDSWSQAPNFGEVVDATIGDLILRCGQPHAMDVVTRLDVFDATWRYITSFVADWTELGC